MAQNYRLNLSPLLNWSRGVGRGPAWDAMYKQWGIRYLAFTRRRFRTFAAGGGDWKPLSPFTIARRRNKNKSSIKILRDTGVLFNGMTLNGPGNLYRRKKLFLDVGFGGSDQHNNDNITISQIAEAHQRGGGRLPRREILAMPDDGTITGLQRDIRMAYRRSTGG